MEVKLAEFNVLKMGNGGRASRELANTSIESIARTSHKSLKSGKMPYFASEIVNTTIWAGKWSQLCFSKGTGH